MTHSTPIIDADFMHQSPRIAAIAAYINIGYTRSEAVRLSKNISSKATKTAA